ncbi:MAG: alpha/beta fold hydrolase [Alcanivoracaceae bacterium]|nr:alpha/beta fold hydrolase [Alcanivoracaceae bacterium]
MALTRKKIIFKGHHHDLAGLLEVPEFRPKAYVLFAHCFTCGKDTPAASRISRALVQLGFAVLRFDFTGLGGSDGDFANSNFSSNVADLVAAADFLRNSYQAPSILVGHSLGGAAVIKAATDIEECKAVVSLAAPANAEHISHLFSCSIADIEQQGEAQVDLGGREFTIQKQFLDDLSEQDSRHISTLNRALLVMHSPLDKIVSINEAEKIYTLARHPKSFVSLDNADHLLTKKIDSDYAAGIIAAWSSRFIESTGEISSNNTPIRKNIQHGHVEVTEINHKFACDIQTDSHQWQGDEPLKVGGDNLGPDPYEHLLAALGTCTVMTVRMYANFKKIPLKNIWVELSHNREYSQDCSDCDKSKNSIDVISRNITFKGDLTEKDIQRLLVIADKCPVHRTLHNQIEVRTELK